MIKMVQENKEKRDSADSEFSESTLAASGAAPLLATPEYKNNATSVDSEFSESALALVAIGALATAEEYKEGPQPQYQGGAAAADKDEEKDKKKKKKPGAARLLRSLRRALRAKGRRTKKAKKDKKKKQAEKEKKPDENPSHSQQPQSPPAPCVQQPRQGPPAQAAPHSLAQDQATAGGWGDNTLSNKMVGGQLKGEGGGLGPCRGRRPPFSSKCVCVYTPPCDQPYIFDFFQFSS